LARSRQGRGRPAAGRTGRRRAHLRRIDKSALIAIRSASFVGDGR
jgi:hypothetical protein